uniref:Immunoglobulin domain-containing protein n=1 Tax=Pelodiscus sinensis TaxID=13735 RepID=K7GE65_PELSI
FPKPSLSVSPWRVAELGENVTFQCEGEQPNMRFVLYNNGRQVKTQEPSGRVAVFPMPGVGLKTRGSYTCQFHTTSNATEWSRYSDPVELVVAGEGPDSDKYPKPAISLSPAGAAALGQDVAVRCWAALLDAKFFLVKVRDRTPLGRAEPVGVGGEFLLRGVRWGDGGNYACYYHLAADPFAWSQPSDPVELVIADYTWGNIVRLALGTGVLLALVLMVAQAAGRDGREQRGAGG